MTDWHSLDAEMNKARLECLTEPKRSLRSQTGADHVSGLGRGLRHAHSECFPELTHELAAQRADTEAGQEEAISMGLCRPR